MKTDHFEGKNPLEHVIEARKKGSQASAENHGTEMPGHYSAAIDAAKETTILISLFFSIILALKLPVSPWLMMAPALMIGWILWKGLRSALLGWSRLERLHRLIEEEKWEIEHHRPQEKEELKALYSAKGFSGKLLNDVIEVLMSDDDRLLRVMLEEELGLQLEAYEHPLKQSLAAAGAVLATSLLLFGTLWIFSILPTFIIGSILICLTSAFGAFLEKNRLLPAIIWNLAGFLFAIIASYFTAQILQ